ncbi:MAG: winged helix-turn-helix transcriptional regulator [Candidatus Omnitrophica bacterium]|nr:winged helix-turn-helix transcriptional regulator [Candidatus Omnitrophota bacterium]
MNPDAYRELKVLEELSHNADHTQRHLAKQLGVALGLTNLMIKRLVRKGYVKIVNLQRNRIRYLVTPQGIAEKTRLTYEYLEYSLYLYRRVREVLQQRMREVGERGGKDIVLFGVGELAEVAYLTIRGQGLNLVGVVDDRVAGTTFLGLAVSPSEALPALQFDAVIVSSLDNELVGLNRLQELGIDRARIIVMEQRGSQIHPVLPGASR